MNKIIKYISVVVIAIITIIVVGFLVWQTKKPSIFTSTVSESLTPDLKLETVEDWKEYTNKTLGFSMWIPVKVLGEDNSFATLNIFEDNKNNVIYFGTSPDLSANDGWRLKVATKSVKNDKELEEFIKEKFGSDCKIGKKEYLYGADDQGVYSYEEISRGIQSNCNATKILYDGSVKKVVAINGVQECRFSATLNNNYGAICYDELMIKSFRFE